MVSIDSCIRPQKVGQDFVVVDLTSHCCVQNAKIIKMEHEKKAAQLRKFELKRADYVKTEKTKKEVEKLESQMIVASQAIETTSSEIIKLREIELCPQLIDLVKGLVFSFFLI